MERIIGEKSILYMIVYTIIGTILLFSVIPLVWLILSDNGLKQSPAWIGPISVLSIGLSMFAYGIHEIKLPTELIIVEDTIIFLARKKIEITFSDIKNVMELVTRKDKKTIGIMITTIHNKSYKELLRNSKYFIKNLCQRIKNVTERDVYVKGF